MLCLEMSLIWRHVQICFCVWPGKVHWNTLRRLFRAANDKAASVVLLLFAWVGEIRV